MSGLNIIVVEDNDDLLEATVDALCRLGHDARGASDGRVLDSLYIDFLADLLVLDLNLPGEDGLSISRRMRAAQPDIGIIIVTARARLEDKVAGYRSGADIYLSKPVSSEELAAAIAALSRRVSPGSAGDATTLNPDKLQLQGSRGVVDVSYQECSLLRAFVDADGHCVNTAQLLEISGKTVEKANKGTLEVQLVRLRKKLVEAGAGDPSIKARRGTGYQLCVPVTVVTRSH